MSFSYDPYAVMRIVLNSDGTFSWLCESCGGGWGTAFTASTSVNVIRRDYDVHVESSHALTREHTKTWHKGF